MNEEELAKRLSILEYAVAGLAMSSGFADGLLPELKAMLANGETAVQPLVEAIELMKEDPPPPGA